ncbi:MAG: iron chelate uptake ABC transporter family permease subunit, partial [Clostridium sp.]|uniref:iron chelate uptake ABC transporter family permease subunit n=1 Tax=Clostridium sp. TaxID=1506 RepID=UPI003F38774D
METSIKREKNIHKKIGILLGIATLAIVLYLTYGVKAGSFEYVISSRLSKIVSMILTGGCIAFASVIFQTITNNNILTPSAIGLDSLYVLIQTIIVFIFGTSSVFTINKNYNFLVSVVSMVLVAYVLYNKLFEKLQRNIVFILLVGMIFGTLFKSISTFMQVVIDPNEYAVLQNSLYASFGNVNTEIILVSIIMLLLMVPFIYDDIKYLDVLSLGKDHAINLGVDYEKLSKKMIIVVAILISIATALVGPLTFLGLIVVNLSRSLVKSYKHKYSLISSIFISIIVIVGGQFLVEKVFTFSTTLSVIVNFLGG